MQAVYMPYRPKNSSRTKSGTTATIIHSPFLILSDQNQYSTTPCLDQHDTAVAYSKGKLSAMPKVSWGNDKES